MEAKRAAAAVRQPLWESGLDGSPPHRKGADFWSRRFLYRHAATIYVSTGVTQVLATQLLRYEGAARAAFCLAF